MKRNDKVHLVYVNKQPYLMVNPFDKLTVKMCNSQVTKDWDVKETDLDKSVFDFFNVTFEIIPIPFDRRTAQFKHFEKQLKYFTVEYLPILKELI